MSPDNPDERDWTEADERDAEEYTRLIRRLQRSSEGWEVTPDLMSEVPARMGEIATKSQYEATAVRAASVLVQMDRANQSRELGKMRTLHPILVYRDRVRQMEAKQGMLGQEIDSDQDMPEAYYEDISAPDAEETIKVLAELGLLESMLAETGLTVDGTVHHNGNGKNGSTNGHNGNGHNGNGKNGNGHTHGGT